MGRCWWASKGVGWPNVLVPVGEAGREFGLDFGMSKRMSGAEGAILDGRAGLMSSRKVVGGKNEGEFVLPETHEARGPIRQQRAEVVSRAWFLSCEAIFTIFACALTMLEPSFPLSPL